MRIAIADFEKDAPYLRHARTEMLRGLEIEPHPSLVELQPVSKFILAYDHNDRPIGMGESAMLNDIYSSYDETAYSAIDLNSYCPLRQMAGMRTVYLEPEYRKNSFLFLAIIFGMAQMYHRLGACFATANTRSDDVYLNRLYTKLCGERVGTFSVDLTNEPLSLFVFNVAQLKNHRFMQRVARDFTFEIGDQKVR